MPHIWNFNANNVGNTSHTMRYANEIHWQEGTPGKGLIHDGIVETWSTLHDNPTHTEYCGTHGIDWDSVMVAFDISPDGGIWSFLKDQVGPEAREIIQEADSRLNVSQASADTWHLGAQGHVLNWTPGNPGSGIMDEHDNIHTWNREYDPDADEYFPHHAEYVERAGIAPPGSGFLIDPEGGVNQWPASFPDMEAPNQRELAKAFEVDPRLRPTQTWHLGSDSGDMLNWDEGQYGKGIIDRDGHVYTWDAEEYEVHDHFLREHPEIMPMRYLDIEPDGRVVDSGLGEPLTEIDEEVLREADPRLYVVIEEQPTWNLNQGLATL
jgi:hypothetical protein